MRYLMSALFAVAYLVWPTAAGAVQGSPTTQAHVAPVPRPSQPPSPPYVMLGKVPVIKLGPQKPISREEAVHIRWLIARLAAIDHGDYGLSPTLSGTVFAPLPGLPSPNAPMLTNPDPQTPAVLRELIALGPRALPFLLAALDDRTPTRLTVRHSTWGAGRMEFGHGGVFTNPMSAAEQKALASVPESLWGVTRSPGDLVQVPAPPGKPWDTSLAYTATIGDACLVEIGQIVGRPYEAISYRPTASIGIDSPSHDPALAYQVRAVWSSNNPAQHLLDSLLLDYSTEEIDTERGVRYHEDFLQYTAVVRLLFYFPRQCAGMIARRLRGLDVSVPPSHFVWQRPWSANQLDDVARFIKAVAWCKEPVIRSALLGVFNRTTDPDILVAALPAIGREHAPLVRSRVSAFLDHLPPYVGRARDDEINLLSAFAQWATPGEAKAVFERYLARDNVERCRNVCYVFRDVRREWDLEMLASLLNDRRPTGGDYRVDPKQSEPRLPARVCDEAAQTLAMNHPDLPLKLAGTHEDLDRQIAAMQKRISTGRR